MTVAGFDKEAFLRALEEDREFRYAVMGLVGFREVLERLTKLEERFAKLEERIVKLEERQQRLEEELRETRRVVIAIAHRFGVLSENAFRHAMRYVVEEVFGVARVEKWVYRDGEGFVYGYPSIIEVDLIVRDGEHILVEVKSRVSRADIAELYRIGELYERIEGIKPRLAIVGRLVDPEAREAATRLGIEIIPITEE